MAVPLPRLGVLVCVSGGVVVVVVEMAVVVVG